MSDSPVMILEMEEALAEDADGSVRDELVSKLRDDGRVVKQAMDQGLPPEEFEQARKIQDALERAARVVELVDAAKQVSA